MSNYQIWSSNFEEKKKGGGGGAGSRKFVESVVFLYI